MADIETLLGMRTGRGADMRALADELRGQSRMGDFLSLSGSRGLRDLGVSQRERAMAAATRGGALREALRTREAQERREAESRRRWEAERATAAEERAYGRERDVLSDERYAAEQARRVEAEAHKRETQARKERLEDEDRKREAEALGSPEEFENRKTGERQLLRSDALGRLFDGDGNEVDLDEYQKPTKVGTIPTTIRKDYTNRGIYLRRGQELLQRLQENPGAVDKWEDVGIHLARSLPGVGGPLANMLEEGAKTPTENEVRAAMRKYEDEVRHLITGANLTRYEINNSDAWRASAAGITPQMAIGRLAELQEALRLSQEEVEQQYFSRSALPGATGARGAATPTPAPAPAQTPPPPPPDPGGASTGLKIIDGKRYFMRGGKWYLDDTYTPEQEPPEARGYVPTGDEAA